MLMSVPQNAAAPGSAGCQPAATSLPSRAGSPRSQEVPRSQSAPAARTAIPDWHGRHYVPHCENRRFQTITWRLFDSLPADIVARMKAELLLLRSAPDTPETAARYVELRKSVDRFEDAGHGACWLADPSIARIVSDNLLHFNGIRYRLLSFCIMPNHVHVLIEVADGWSLSRILHGWRSFTANEANKLLGRTGRFWMEEYFDRYIRDERHFLNVQSYIRMNPVKAGLVADPAAWPWTWETPGSAGCQPATPTPLHNSPTQDTP